MKMRRTVRNAWVKALRSGEYEQAQGALAKVDGDAVAFCCLGVLCDLAVVDGVQLDVGMDDDNVGSRRYDEESAYPPAAVVEWGQVDTDGGTNPSWMTTRPDEDSVGEIEYVDLAGRNDSGSLFQDIADLIENDSEAEFDVRDDLAVTP